MSKSNPCKNALSHGFYATDVVLPWEVQQEFDDLHQAVRDEYCPDGVSEEEVVFELANLLWKKRRFEAGLQKALRERGDPTVADTISDDLDYLANLVGTATKRQIKASQIAGSEICKHWELLDNADQSIVDREIIEIEKLNALAKDLQIGRDDLLSLVRDFKKQKQDRAERSYNPDIMEKELKLRAEIDRRIEKTLKILVMAKEIKKLYAPKAVGGKSIEMAPAG